jgi:dTDP-4-amino-4,6-dideoxygalactose transaminase
MGTKNLFKGRNLKVIMSWISKKKIDEELVKSHIKKCLETNQFTNQGFFVNELETHVRKLFEIDDNKSVILVTNGTVALQVLTNSILHYENKNINWATQSFTFPPSAQINPNVKIIDIDKDGGLDLNKVDKNNINGLIITNIFGNVVDIKKYESFCKENNMFLIFDNAASAYTFYNGKNCLNYGNGSIISFHHTKPFGFGEGGCIVVDNKYEKTIRCLNNFGIGLSDNYWNKLGSNNKMSEISAIYILQYLINNFDKIKKHHNSLYEHFSKKNKKIMFPNFSDNKIVPSCLCVLIEKNNNEIINKLIEHGFQVRKYYNPLDESKVSNEIYKKIICLPCNLDISKNDLEKINEIINSFT